MSNYSHEKAAIILTGGKSQRMGTKKAELHIGDKTMLQHMSALFLNVVPHVVVVKAPQQDFSPLPASVIWAMDTVANEGPLRGLEAGLMALPKGIKKVFVSGCDAPLLKPELIPFLFEKHHHTSAVIPRVGGFFQPLTAVYATHILSIVSSLLGNGERSLQVLIRSLDICEVGEDELRQVDPQLLSFENANTPADYNRLLAYFKK